MGFRAVQFEKTGQVNIPPSVVGMSPCLQWPLGFGGFVLCCLGFTSVWGSGLRACALRV